MSNEAVVEVKNLSCLSGSQFLLNNISWTINKGEQGIVFGRNGCGKTTLLSIVAGYKQYSSGKLAVFEQNYSAENILDIRKKIGWISSSFPINITTRRQSWILSSPRCPAHWAYLLRSPMLRSSRLSGC